MKEAKVSDEAVYFSLTQEDRYFTYLQQVATPHIIRRIGPSHNLGQNDTARKLTTKPNARLFGATRTAELNGRANSVGRIFLEYCERGSLNRLLSWRDAKFVAHMARDDRSLIKWQEHIFRRVDALDNFQMSHQSMYAIDDRR